MPNSLKTRLKNLPLISKMVLVGSFLAIIGSLLPWYKDIDKFNTGDMFLGISGPLYLAGIIVMLAGIASFGMILMRLINKPTPKLPVREDQFHAFTSSLSILMLVLSVSVFFHNKFGIGIVDKSLGIGIIMSFIGACVVLIAAVKAMNEKTVDFDVAEGHLEPLIDLNAELRDPQKLGIHRPNMTSDDLEVKTTVQESIDEFTGSNNHTKDIQI